MGANIVSLNMSVIRVYRISVIVAILVVVVAMVVVVTMVGILVVIFLSEFSD
jgi:hypothetical protein